MERTSVETIVRSLNEADVRYLIVGGLAVVAHGFVRFTADVDLVLDPQPESLARAVAALAGLGYRPRAPVEFKDFADARQRAAWKNEKGLTVFSAFSPEHPATEIDLFLEPPFDFDRSYARAVRIDIARGAPATFVAGDIVNDPGTPDERVWELGWDEHSRAQRARLSRLSLPEKLAWLEEAHRLVIRLQAARKGPDPGQEPPGKP